MHIFLLHWTLCYIYKEEKFKFISHTFNIPLQLQSTVLLQFPRPDRTFCCEPVPSSVSSPAMHTEKQLEVRQVLQSRKQFKRREVCSDLIHRESVSSNEFLRTPDFHLRGRDFFSLAMCANSKVELGNSGVTSTSVFNRF